ncbi:formylmethanofuran dehydrogenase [Caballeronia sp. LZ016]|uniref:formylmethanofuran dehydrogenase n=1 Tax=Caballeronia sp. LZ016 TaxID=3038554 RepID=UPI00285497F9|nr:formylmethanofuran dehydrogenase [Caballeronia sp. LZ016]MDR5739981.1 formylmethanofuran dehydrogenase [Caballeronia sp. LZ016]
MPTPPLEAPAQKTCPFCPLLCEDIVLTASLEAPNTTCPRLAQSLAAFNIDDEGTKPQINGKSTDLPTALSEASRILEQSRRPLFAGMATDITGARALYELAAHTGAILDHMHGDALAASTLALQDRGAFFTTLSEIRSRADLIVIIACEPSRRYPRFYERVLNLRHNTDIVFVGCNPDPAASAHAKAILQDADTFDILALWSALTERRNAHTPTAQALQTLHERIQTAHYTAFIYEPATLPAPHAALAIEAINRIVKTINRTARAGALALTGDDGALSVNQAVTWLSGFPLRTRIAYGLPLDHDPHRYRTEDLLRRKETDALLWISSFGPEPLPPSLTDDVPAIVLGHPGTTVDARKATTVFIPVATPGIDSNGHLFRVDASVVVPLAAARDTALPTVASIASELIRARRP